MYERLEECPVCKHPKFTNKIICKDHLVTQESFALVSCDKCGLLFTNPRPTKDRLNLYYQSDQYISHTNKPTSLINLIYKLVRKYTIRNKYKLITQHHEKGKILDYGCGTGDLLKYFNDNKWQTLGIEPDDNARKIATDKNKLSILKKVSELEKDSSYDVIMLWHVLEHVDDLKKTARKLVRHLSDHGTMFIAVPNHLSYDAQHYQENWAGYDVPRHLYHFNPLNIKELFKKMKVKLIKTVPMTLDAYYVSLLSEKNKNGTNNFIKAIQNGYQSNKYAKSNDGNYSSLIYIVKK